MMRSAWGPNEMCTLSGKAEEEKLYCSTLLSLWLSAWSTDYTSRKEVSREVKLATAHTHAAVRRGFLLVAEGYQAEQWPMANIEQDFSLACLPVVYASFCHLIPLPQALESNLISASWIALCGRMLARDVSRCCCVPWRLLDGQCSAGFRSLGRAAKQLATQLLRA
jgi:hypothetical protein